ncbi:MAG: hypothetical protein ACFCUQ_00080 [Kiloniellales bacterium]
MPSIPSITLIALAVAVLNLCAVILYHVGGAAVWLLPTVPKD